MFKIAKKMTFSRGMLRRFGRKLHPAPTLDRTLYISANKKTSSSKLLNEPDENISVSKYYNGRSIFLTGGSGHLGKVLVEKLLRACPGLENIYFLIRPKKGLTEDERIREIFSLPLFSKLLEINPDAMSKIIPITGDIAHHNLGISEVDRRKIADNCNIVIHSAATVNFDTPLRVAVQMNCIAVREVVKLTKEIRNLEVFCHISTAAAHLQRDRTAEDVIEEAFYPAPIKPQRLIDAMEDMSDDMLNSVTKSALAKYPNTYAFTKAIGESMLEEEASDLPLIIIRPSFISSIMRDPMPGWIVNNIISGYVAAIAKGIVRTVLAPESVKANFVPADLVSNFIIVSVWYHALTRPSDALICNCTSDHVDPSSFLDLFKICKEMMAVYPYKNIVRTPNFSTTGVETTHVFRKAIRHYIPALLFDGASLLVGSKRRFINMYKKIEYLEYVSRYFRLNWLTFDTTSHSRILKAIPKEDIEDFDFDMSKICWKSHYEVVYLGVKEHVSKEIKTSNSKPNHD